MPLPSRRVLDELRPYLPDTDRGATPVVHTFAALQTGLAAHDEAVARRDRAEARFIAARDGVTTGEPAVATDASRAGDARQGASDGLERRVGTRSIRQRHGRGIGSKRSAFRVREARDRRVARRVSDLTDELLSTPAAGCGDLAIKLAVTIAAGEGGSPEAASFPWCHLRQILAEMTSRAVSDVGDP